MTLARELADTAGRPQVDKNLLINGGMNIWQRSTSLNNISTTGYWTADRWQTVISSLGIYTQSRSTDVPSGQGFGYSLKMDCTFADASPSSTNYLYLSQKIEAQNLQHLLFGTSSPKSITLSFWVKSNKTGTYIINAIKPDGGIRFIAKAYTIDTANTWEKKTITFEGDETNAIANDNGYGIDFQWWLGAGSNYTSGTLQTTWAAILNASADRAVGQVNLSDSTSNEFYITGCQLEVGEAATDFQFEPYATTQNKCYRYYFRMVHDNKSTGAFQQFLNGFWGLFNNGTDIGASKITPVEMRSDDLTLTYSNRTHFDIEPFDQAPNAITVQSTSRWGVIAVFTSPTSRTTGLAGIVGLDITGSWYAIDDEL
jgi:hypothetical protein